MQKILHILVSGRVQLVMYRDFSQRKARALGLTGTVQNLSDGTVEIYVRGEEERLQRFVEKLHTGPVLARVDDVFVEEVDGDPVFEGFKIVY